jgi:hypothetical protein
MPVRWVQVLNPAAVLASTSKEESKGGMVSEHSLCATDAWVAERYQHLIDAFRHDIGLFPNTICHICRCLYCDRAKGAHRHDDLDALLAAYTLKDSARAALITLLGRYVAVRPQK